MPTIAHRAATGGLLILLVGCVRPSLPEPAPVSAAWADSGETTLGRGLAPRIAEHPGESGIYVLGSGLDAFAARLLSIERAERAVDVQYYIFRDDVTGRFTLSRLLAAADRGVRVRLLLDDVGSAGLDDLLAAADVHPQLEVRLFNPVARGSLRVLDLLARARRLNHRMHNKMLAADAAVAIVGGRNIADEYFDASPDVNFADLDLLVTGPVLGELGESFDLYWNDPLAVPIRAWKRLRREPEDLARLRDELAAHELAQRDSPYARRLGDSNLVQEVTLGGVRILWAPTRAVADLPEKAIAKGKDVEGTLLKHRLEPAFDEVDSELLIVSPYFIPREAGVEYLSDAVSRGVRVRVLTNSLAATDVAAVHAGYKRYRRELVEAGVELFELRRSGDTFRRAERAGVFGSSSASLHAKTFCFDRERVFVGSLNLDPRSVDLNTELGLVVKSRELADRQADGFERMTRGDLSWRLSLDEDGDLVWEAEEAGRAQRFTREPDVGRWKRFTVFLMGLLPIEGQL